MFALQQKQTLKPKKKQKTKPHTAHRSVSLSVRACVWRVYGWCFIGIMCVCVTERTAKGRTNIELREQFILADGVSQSMAAFTSRRSTPNAAQTAANSSHNGGAGSPNMPPYMSGQGPIIKVNHKKTKQK